MVALWLVALNAYGEYLIEGPIKSKATDWLSNYVVADRHTAYISRTDDSYIGSSFIQAVSSLYSPTRKEQNVLLGERLAYEAGMYGREWECLYELGMQESGWDETATNKSSGAYGIPQSLPASKLDSYGNRHSPEVQIRWMIDYVFDRYGTACNALSWQLQNNWY